MAIGLLFQSSSTLPIAQRLHRRMTLQRAGMLMILVALIAAIGMGLLSGGFDMHPGALVQSWLSDAEPSAPLTMQTYVLLELRLPRVLMAVIVGALLSMAGCAMQGLVRNPLADPGLIGIAGGAAAAAALSMAVVPSMVPLLAPYWVALWAFFGALSSVWLVVRFANTAAGLSIATLILAGVAINALTGTLIGAVSYVASDDALRQISYWTMGSLAGASVSRLALLCVAGGIAICGFYFCRNALDLLALGENEARSLGLNVNRYKQALLWLVAFAVAMATALCGIIGFVGLVVPHMARTLFGVNHQCLMPVCGLLGALLMVLADTLSRTLFPPLEIPIGIVTSAIGAPFFLYLLWQQKARLGYGQ